ncbi:MAG: acyltransferase family protein [Lachnospiraceae bacterium]
MKTKRLNYLDMAKGIGIILVVIGHSTFVAAPILTWISSFHMPLFMIISGMLLWHTKEESRAMSDTIRRKAKVILIPYVSFSIIYMIFDLIEYWLDPITHSLVTIKDSLIATLTLYGISVLWFLPALFIGEISFLFIRKHTNHIVTIGIALAMLLLVSIVRPLSEGSFLIVLFRGAMAYIFLTIGYYCKQYLQEKSSVQGKEILLAIGLLLLNVAVSIQNGRVDLNMLVLKQPILYFVGAVSGSLALILLCKNLQFAKMHKVCHSLQYLGINSLTIMVTHLDCRVMIASITIAYWLNQYITRAKSYIFYLCIMLFVTLFELLIIYVVNHYMPFIMGKKPYKGRGKLHIYTKTDKTAKNN